jgi:hypothetical protein
VTALNVNLREIKIEDYKLLETYYHLRRPETADSNLMDLYMWMEQYPTKYFLTDSGLIWVANSGDGTYYTSVPCCREEDLQENFLTTKRYFNEVLHKKLVMYLVDRKALASLELPEEEYVVVPDRTYADYVYDAEKLRRFPGKNYHGKKNHLNAFRRTYEGRYRFSLMTSEQEQEIMDFLEEWKQGKEDTKEHELIDAEIQGIRFLMKHEDIFQYKIGGVYIDEKLQAFTIGNYSEIEDMVYIPVEKANSKIRGLYQYLCSEFLIQAFPNAGKVNREDDMGLEGLRKSKLSYHPIYLVEKYTIIQK